MIVLKKMKKRSSRKQVLGFTPLVVVTSLAFVFVLLLLSYYFYSYQAGSSKKSSKTYTIGVIQNASNMDIAYNGLKDALRKIGYVEGKNITFVHSNVNSDETKSKEFAQNLVSQKVDIIVTMGIVPTKAAQEATKGTNIPVVFTIVANPQGNKFISSFQKPGGNLTGVDSGIAQTSTKRLALLKEMAPNISRVLIFYNSAASVSLDDVRATAKNLGMSLVERKVENLADLDRQMSQLKVGEFDAIFRTGESINSPRVDQLISLALTHKVPYSGTNNADTEKGGLMSYGTDFYKFGEQAASFVDKIFKGQNPGSMPVEQPKDTDFYININTASQIGITIPNSVQQRATKIIR